jgi:uncharacterized protein HemY
LGEADKGQEILRLAIQYAGDTSMAPEVFTILGCSMLGEKRFGESIGVLKRAANLGADGKKLWPLIADAFAERGFWAPSMAAILRAKRLGASGPEIDRLHERAVQNLGPAFSAWERHVNAT